MFFFVGTPGIFVSLESMNLCSIFFFVAEILLFCYRGCRFFVVFYRFPKRWGV